ncbi:MAG: antibiotic biosynthesis monooxygenase [Sphingobium sp.]
MIDAEPPYYAVIFTSDRTDADGEGYGAAANLMAELAAAQPGNLGMDSAREEIGITISYWRDLDAIAAWKRNADHVLAQRSGREIWYASYSLHVARVERAYHFEKRSGEAANP